MPGLKTTLTMDGAQYDRTLARAVATSSAAGKQIQRNLSGGGGGQDDRYWAARLAQQRAGLQKEVAEQMAADRLTAAARLRLAAANRVELASARVAAFGGVLGTRGVGGSVQEARNELAGALKAERAMRDFAGAAGAAKGVLPGLNIVMRESLVILREMGRGNWARIPGSFTVLLQGLATMGVSVGALGVGLGVVAAAGLVVYETFWGLKKAMEGMKLPMLSDTYVPKIKRSAAETAQAQAAITEEVDKTTEAYNSAAEAAQRVTAATKEHFDHLRRMSGLSKEAELAGAKTPAEKMAIEERYAAQELQFKAAERAQNLANKQKEQANLQAESSDAWQRSRGIKVNTKEEDEKIQSQLEENAKAADAFQKGGGFWDEFKKQAAADFGGLPWKRNQRMAAIDSAQDVNAQSAQDRIDLANSNKDKMLARDDLRKQREDLEKKAGKSASDAAKLGLEITDLKKTNRQSDQDDAEESAAQLAAERAGLGKGARSGRSSLNADQRIGAYSAGTGDVHRALTLMEAIVRNTAHLRPEPHPPVGRGRAAFGGIHQ